MGSCVYGANVISTGTEIDFWKYIKAYLTGLSTRITCSTDIDAEFDISTKGGDYAPVMDFSIDGTHIFKFSSNSLSYGSSTGNKSIAFAMNADNDIPAANKNIGFNTDGDDNRSIAINTSFSRGLKISHIINDDFIFLAFTSCGSWSYAAENNMTSFAHCKSNNNVYLGPNGANRAASKSNLFNLSSLLFYCLTTPSSTGTFLSRFSYGCLPGTIDYIKSSIYAASGEKVFENRAVYDCTTVTVGDTVSLKDGAYVAIGAHQLVKVS